MYFLILLSGFITAQPSGGGKDNLSLEWPRETSYSIKETLASYQLC